MRKIYFFILLLVTMLSMEFTYCQNDTLTEKNATSFFIVPLVYHNSIAINYERDISGRWALGFTLYGQASLIGVYGYYMEIDYYPHTSAGLIIDCRYKTKLSSSYFKPSITTYSLLMHHTYQDYGRFDEYLRYRGVLFGQGLMIGTKFFYSRKRLKYIQIGIGAAIACKAYYYNEYSIYSEYGPLETLENKKDGLTWWGVTVLPRINFTFGGKFRGLDDMDAM